MTVANLEPGNRIQLPAEWVAALGSPAAVVLDRTADGILVRPCVQGAAEQRASWADVFANKLPIGSAAAAEGDEDFEITGDDLSF